IEKNERLVPAGIINPGLKLLPGRAGASRIVGKAKVHKVQRFLRRLRHKVVGLRGLEIKKALVASILEDAGPARHDVGVDVDWVDRVRHAKIGRASCREEWRGRGSGKQDKRRAERGGAEKEHYDVR